MNNEYNYLEEYEWLGEFWSPSDRDNTFPGILRYTPSDGISISALVSFDEKETTSSDIFHGYCQETGSITLIGCFLMSDGATNGITVSPRLFCNHLLIGEHFPQDHKFDGCNVEPSNFREFCYPQGFKLDDVYTKEPVFEAVLNDIKISVNKTAKGTFLSPEKISSKIWVDEENSLFERELNVVVSKLADKHNVKSMFSKTDVGTVIEITKADNSKDHYVFYTKAVLNLTSLLSMLIIRPVIPLCMSLFVFSDDEDDSRKRSFPMLSSIVLNKKDQDLILKDTNYRRLNVNISDIKEQFLHVMKEWNSIYSDSTDFVLSVLQEHIAGRQNAIQHAVVAISALEQWYFKYEKNNEDTPKYDYIF